MAWLSKFAATVIILLAPAAALNYSAVYHGWMHSCEDAPIKIRIGNGGAGQSGLIQALADTFIQFCLVRGIEPFRIAWYESDTTYSLASLKTGDIDVAITYNRFAEHEAVKQGYVDDDAPFYIFNDHFLLVGPRANPANLSQDNTVEEMFSAIFHAAEGEETMPPVRFLSRFDKSATNILESNFWIKIGQVPWANTPSPWYHQFSAFPREALIHAIEYEEYTLTDRGTFLSLPRYLRNSITVFKAGTDDGNDPLLNAAYLSVGTRAQNVSLARFFGRWTMHPNGQTVIKHFGKGEEPLYSGSPIRTLDELGRM
ncbi:hypothetical protein CDD81_6647 [Ophiocordyceps australis]|uniref:PBP domain-containing protein n=1 Tax=Ophiocordyceps australis TaxID=1399860 RepID=A0A2C5Y2E1_9HYPO|nr:hypothetical protein CDD81_6647 [Ophiocordyceps australis]